MAAEYTEHWLFDPDEIAALNPELGAMVKHMNERHGDNGIVYGIKVTPPEPPVVDLDDLPVIDEITIDVPPPPPAPPPDPRILLGMVLDWLADDKSYHQIRLMEFLGYGCDARLWVAAARTYLETA